MNDSTQPADQLPDAAGAQAEERALPSPGDALAAAAFEAATTPRLRRRIKDGKGLAVVVVAPGAAWVAPLASYVGDLMEASIYARDGEERPKYVPSTGNKPVAQTLAEGRSVLGISQHPDRLLPDVLVAAADIIVRVDPPSPAVIAAAMRRSLGRPVPRALPQGLGAGLDFEELVSAMRPRATARQVIARIQAMADARSTRSLDADVPRLEDAIHLGEAREWGLRLARDVADVRRGIIGWSDVDRGCVLYGEPGTGKSFAARMIARAASLNYIESSVAELFAGSAGYLDSVIKAQRQVFARAAASAPSLLFWDEIDSLPNRATISPRGKDWWMPVIEDFLLLLSSTPPGVITLGATNRIEDVDSAILRPGRLERRIEVKAATTAEGLAANLRFQLGKDLPGADLLPAARLGVGASAAVAMEWVRSARRSARAAKRALTLDDLIGAIAPPEQRDPAALRRSAIHEAGHAAAATALGLTVERVTLLKTRSSGGQLVLTESGHARIYHREAIEKNVVMTLAARAAEMVWFGTASAGAAGLPDSDVAIATNLLAAVHASFALGNTIAYRTRWDRAGELLDRDPRLRAIVERDLQRLHAEAERIVRRHRPAVEAIADALIARRMLTGPEIKNLFDAASPAPTSSPSKEDPDDTFLRG